MTKRNQTLAEPAAWKLLLWTAVAALIFGLIGFGEIAEDLLRASRNSLHRHKASGDIVLVQIDDKSLRQVGRWPWPRRYHAELTNALTHAGAKRIFFDFTFFGPTNLADDNAFAEAIERSQRVVLAARTRQGPQAGTEQHTMPMPTFTAHAQVGAITWQYNYQNAVWRLPYSVEWQGKAMPSFAALLGERQGSAGDTFIPDYSIDLKSIPSVSAADILHGLVDPGKLRGKDVIIGPTSNASGDLYFLPGTGQMGGVYVHLVGAETLKRGSPIYLGWLACTLLTLCVAAIAITRRGTSRRTAILGAAALSLLLGPVFLESRLIFVDITPALFTLAIISIALLRCRFRQQGLVNPVSGLPNLTALRSNREGRNRALIGARVLNFEEILATLPPNSERELVDQIVSRLALGASQRVLYQGDGGIFAWFEDPRQPFANHLEALHALFRNPARVAGLSIDLSVTFGVEVGSGRSLANRLASAMVAADEAAHQGLKWKYHDPETLEDASWKLSMLSQLDEAIDRGEVWVAYQPKLDLSTRRIIGAEALARWTHPEKGPIAATEFVAAAEQHGRIGKLTDFVLAEAMAAAAQINLRGIAFEVAVNLSARLLSDKGFTLRLSALLARHGLAPRHLTLELTETAAMSDGEGLEIIERLRDLGVNISIDDYGTGMSTLEYLKKIPASELKIDQTFVKGIVDNRSDRLMVQSTIGLAHSLGRKVVAEGVEQRDVLHYLTEMKCDMAQGFVIGRPMSLDSLTKRLASERRRSAA